MGALRTFPPVLLALVPAAGLIGLYVLYRFTVTPLIKPRWLRILCVELMIAMTLTLGLWPLLAAAILVWRREYVLAALPALYALPYCLATALLGRPILALIRVARVEGHEAARAKMVSFVERLRCAAPTEDQIAEHKGRLRRIILGAIDWLYTAFVLPPTSLKVAFGVRLGVRVAFWPDLDSALYVLFIVLAYILAANHHPLVASVLSGYLLTLELYQVVSRFETKGGVLRALSYGRHQLGPSTVVFAALVIAAAFGCVHFSISQIDPASYSRPLSAIDGLYFSVTTFATVGYGDIFPRSSLAKLACVGEIFSGVLVLLFGVNLVMSIWIQKVAVAKPTEPPATGEASKLGSPK